MLWDNFILRKEEQFQKKIKYLGVFIVIVLSLIIMRLAYLQLYQGKRFGELSARNRVRLVPIKAQRGLIYDRHHELLVGNVPAFTVCVIPAGLPKDPPAREQVFTRLRQFIEINPEEIREKLRRRKLRFFEALRLKSNVDRDTAAMIEEHRLALPGVVVLTESQRHYKFDSLGFHALGYVGEISENELAIREGYQSGDIIGQAGVEKLYDHYLKGRNGWLHIEVDALGRQMGILGRETPWAGHNLILSLDRKLQEYAETLLSKKKGVILVEDVRTGEMLVMASSPGFNPNVFARGIKEPEWKKVCRDRSYPLTNRATQGLYPPGSIFKIVTLLAALEENLVVPGQCFNCQGVFWISTWPYRCWRKSGHGRVNARRSLVESCDVYYYNIGLKIKVDTLGKWARKFGYGRPSGIDVPNELSGLVPSAQWKERTQNMPWFPGNTVMMSIGQGYILGTPLHLLNTIAAVANQGLIYRPHLLKQVRAKSGRVIFEVEPGVMHKVNAKPKHWRIIQESLRGVVNDRRGTGRQAGIPGMKIAGKTATCQNPHGEDHAGFAAYAPAGKPEIAVVIYLENEGGGGSKAAPLARKMMEAYFGILREEPVETE